MKNFTSFVKSLFKITFVCFLLTLTNSTKAATLYANNAITTVDDCDLPAPSNARVVKVNSYSASVSWSDVAGNAGYRVQIYEVINEVTNPVAIQDYEQQTTGRVFTNLMSGRKYKITIEAICPVSQSFNLRSGNRAVVVAVIHDDIIFSQRPTNPFSSQINLTYEIATPGLVDMGILDANGTQIIQVVNNQYKEQGTYQTTIPTEGVKPGMYFLNYRRGSTVRTLKILKLN